MSQPPSWPDQPQPPAGEQPQAEPWAHQPPPPGWGPPPPQGWGAPPQGYGHPPGFDPYGQPQRTNGLAIASLVCGILWLWFVGSVLAVVLGYVAKRQIRERNEAGDGLATAGIVLGWIGIGLFVLTVLLLGVLY